MATSAVFYAKQRDVYILKFTGEVRYTMGCSLNDFLDRLFAREDYQDIILDLSEAEFIDSTVLGLLAKIANFVRNRFAHKTTLISNNDEINQLLYSVGFDEVFVIYNHNNDGTCDSLTQQLTVSAPERNELAKTVLQAHRILSELNDSNRQRFKNVIQALQEDWDSPDSVK